MKAGMCKGCDSDISMVQVKFYNATGKRLDPAEATMEPFCEYFGIHLEWMGRVYPGNETCPCWHRDGLT